jgi:hypothetical protein
VLTEETDNLFRQLPDPEELNNMYIIPEAATFFDVLSCNIMLSARSFQGFLAKKDAACRNFKLKQLEELKLQYQLNAVRIHQIERELSLMAEEKVRQKIDSLKIFENLNSEKPTPLFLSLTKNRSSGILDSIKRDDGSEFPNQASRRKFIYEEYAKIYKKVDIVLREDCINEFLGPEIANHELVLGSKLTNAEKTRWMRR